VFERFTQAAREVVIGAQEQARQLKHPFVGTEHLLLALLDPAAGVPAAVLREAGVDVIAVRQAIQRLVPSPRPALTDEDAEALRTIGIDLQAVLARLEDTLGAEVLTAGAPAPRRRGFLRRRGLGGRQPGGRVPFTGRAKKVLELSLREAIALKHDYIGSEHILLGLIREGEGLAARVLVDAGVDLSALRRATLRSLDDAA
jgi:ATP-dependent Clp protease ATP-binding subunit ClpA